MKRIFGPKTGQFLGLVGIYLVLALLGIEAGIRGLLYIEWRREMRVHHVSHRPDSVIGYRLVPGRKAWGVGIDSLGCRGSEFSLNKPAGTFRIVCAGNSITYGEYADSESATYPAVLEQIVRGRGEIAQPVEVINAGVMGYTSYQSLVDLKTRLLSFHPDFIILCSGWNDMTFSKYIGWTRDMNWDNPWHFWSLRGSYALWLLKEKVFHVPFSVKPEPLRAYVENLEEFASLCRENHIALAFLDPPTIYSRVMTALDEKKCEMNYFVAGELPLYNAYRSAMNAVAASRNIPVLDTGLTYDVSNKDSLIVDVCHPNDAGYRAMVEVLYPQVVQKVKQLLKNDSQTWPLGPPSQQLAAIPPSSKAK